MKRFKNLLKTENITILTLVVLFIFSTKSLATTVPINDAVKDLIVIVNAGSEDWEYEPNFRTVVVLDAAVVENSNIERQADYQPVKEPISVKQDIMYGMADIIELRNFSSTSKRQDVRVSGDSDYSYKLKRLIDDNVMTRDSYYASKDFAVSIDIGSDKFKNQGK